MSQPYIHHKQIQICSSYFIGNIFISQFYLYFSVLRTLVSRYLSLWQIFTYVCTVLCIQLYIAKDFASTTNETDRESFKKLFIDLCKTPWNRKSNQIRWRQYLEVILQLKTCILNGVSRQENEQKNVLIELIC